MTASSLTVLDNHFNSKCECRSLYHYEIVNPYHKFQSCLSVLVVSAENFLTQDFDVKEHANAVLQSGVTISSQLAKISEGILLLNKELHAQVVAHHDNLLSQATGVETLEGKNLIFYKHTSYYYNIDLLILDLTL